MEKLEGYSVERRLDVALQLIGTVFFAMCDGLGENAARRVISSLYEFSDVGMADPACAAIAEIDGRRTGFDAGRCLSQRKGGTLMDWWYTACRLHCLAA